MNIFYIEFYFKLVKANDARTYATLDRMEKSERQASESCQSAKIESSGRMDSLSSQGSVKRVSKITKKLIFHHLPIFFIKIFLLGIYG